MPIAIKAHLKQTPHYTVFYVEFENRSTVAYPARNVTEARAKASKEFPSNAIRSIR